MRFVYVERGPERENKYANKINQVHKYLTQQRINIIDLNFKLKTQCYLVLEINIRKKWQDFVPVVLQVPN